MKVTRFLRAALTICALFAGLISTARADFHIERGDTTGAATLDVGAIYIDAGAAVPYDAIDFTVSAGGHYQFLLQASFDSAIFLYFGGLDPTSPTTNLIAHSNDLVSPDTSGIIALLFPGYTGAQYTLVVTGIQDDEFGNYSLTVGGPGAVSAVPEPSAWLMLSLGLLGAACHRRRKTAH